MQAILLLAFGLSLGLIQDHCAGQLSAPQSQSPLPTESAQAAETTSETSPQVDESQSDVALAILYRCLHESVFAKQPAQSEVRQTISIAGKKTIGVGHYVRGGKRLGQLRYSLQFSSRDQLNTMLQVCDGQRLLTLEEVQGERSYSEVDISQVRSRLAQNGLNDKTLYDKVYLLHLSIGGQSEVLRTLCQKYTWHSVSEATVEGQPAWRLLGTIATTPQNVHGLAPVDEQMFANSRSKLIPNRVEAIVATNDAALPFWLHRIVYQRASTGEEGIAEQMEAITEWHSPQILSNGVDPQLFQTPGAGGHTFLDDTSRYVPPLNLAASPEQPTLR